MARWCNGLAHLTTDQKIKVRFLYELPNKTMKSHIVDDGHLDKLDLDFEITDPETIRSIIPDSLKAMELPSKITVFTAEDVFEHLKAGSEERREKILDELSRMMSSPDVEDKEIF